MATDINAIRSSLKPVGDPNDWENNEDYMHPDNFKIRLFQMLDDINYHLKADDRSKLMNSDEFLAEMDELAKEIDEED
jgi:uncharacterized protein (DUF1499 family)